MTEPIVDASPWSDGEIASIADIEGIVDVARAEQSLGAGLKVMPLWKQEAWTNEMCWI